MGAWAWFLADLAHGPFPCVAFHLHAFATINCIMNITDFLSPVSPPTKSLSLRVALGAPLHGGSSGDQPGGEYPSPRGR